MSKIQFYVGVGIKAPIAEGLYIVKDVEIQVSYPDEIDLGIGLLVVPAGFSSKLVLPTGVSTLFVVSWDDPKDKDANKLKIDNHLRHLVIHKALNAINEILLAYKLVTLGNSEGRGIRTIGLSDTLFYFPLINGLPGYWINAKQLHFLRKTGFLENGTRDDPFNITALAIPHIATNTYPVAKRYTRCYELLEHGFYSEAFIIAFSILDDMIQEMLHNKLIEKGMQTKSDRDDLLRGIKENRLKIFLGPLLKIISGSSINELWPKGEQAVGWLNRKRNDIAHSGSIADYESACIGVYACVKLLHILNKSKLVNAEFSVDFLRHSEIRACRTSSPPDWVPVNPQ